jgi:dCTP deaminase
MVLTDREIQLAIQFEQIAITPAPRADAFSSTSLDLTLAARAKRWKLGRGLSGVEAPIISPGAPNYSYADVVRDYTEDFAIDASGFVLEPNTFLLGWTIENVRLPHHARIAARVEGKRLGIGIHVTAPTIHAGFEGQIQLELFNHGPVRVRLVPGQKICQLIFEQTLGTPEKGYAGIYAQQKA